MSALTLTVVRAVPIAQGLMQRVTLAGEGLERIPNDYHGKHIKLLFKREGQAELMLPYLKNGKVCWPNPKQKPYARTYSIYQYHQERNELDVDFVLHEPAGVASRFAKTAKVGDKVGFSGPGPIQLIDRNCTEFLMVADLSALPAVGAVAESLATFDQLTVLLETEKTDRSNALIETYFPTTGAQVQIIPQLFQPELTLHEPFRSALKTMNIDKLSVLLAGEHSTVVSLRKLCRETQIPKTKLYAVPYWRHLKDEESYHAERHDVLDN